MVNKLICFAQNICIKWNDKCNLCFKEPKSNYIVYSLVAAVHLATHLWEIWPHCIHLESELVFIITVQSPPLPKKETDLEHFRSEWLDNAQQNSQLVFCNYGGGKTGFFVFLESSVVERVILLTDVFLLRVL